MKRSKHSLSHYRLLTCKMGQLVPIALLDVIPGDTIQQATSLMIRCAPMNAPVMHPTHIRIWHFFVPYRLLWTSWQNFITGGADGLNASTFPYITMTPSVSSLADYLGVPTGTAVNPSALPFRAYALIFNEYFRDEQLVTALALSTADGADATTSTTLQNVAWEKDYYTSARTSTQLGSAVVLPIGTRANVKRTDSASPANKYYQVGSNTQAAAGAVTIDAGGKLTDAGSHNITLDPWQSSDPSGLYADMTSVTGASINDLRHAFALQKYEEARNRYGSRFTEYLRYAFGVRSSDARLQRPEFLASGKQTLQFSEVLQTAVTTSGTPTTGVGSLLGHGIGAVRSNRYRRFFEEHGVVMSLMSVLPITVYRDGMPRYWSKTSKEDFYQRELEHIGMQPILNQELRVAAASPTGTFGYNDRYDEYRRQESQVHGLFRSTYDYWHFAREFGTDPALNSSFVTSNPRTTPFQDTSSDNLLVMAQHSIQARRLVSKVGTPLGV